MWVTQQNQLKKGNYNNINLNINFRIIKNDL